MIPHLLVDVAATSLAFTKKLQKSEFAKFRASLAFGPYILLQLCTLHALRPFVLSTSLRVTCLTYALYLRALPSSFMRLAHLF